MNDPILEALNFALDTDLHVDEVRVPSSSVTSDPLYSRRPLSKPKNSKKILPSALVLGENTETPCLFLGCQVPSNFLSDKEAKDQFLAHLLTQHHVVIDDVDKIANLHKYIIHWKERFASHPVSDFCVGFVMDDIPTPEPPRPRKRKSPFDSGSEQISDAQQGQTNQELTTEAVSDKLSERPTYFMLTPALPEDKELRSKLWNARLETVLEVNREEREQTDFSRQCFFCREIFSGNRSNLFNHMITDHSFRIGKPDNIVFVEEFLELISAKLNDLICLHCEKVFKDKTILRDHMRKKGHKRLNANNPEYNRYYIINYLEPGKDWKALEEEDQEDDRIEEDWTEANEESTNIVCLLCSEQSSNFDEILNHMKTTHSFDFLQVTENLDFYQKVKVVNFIRRTVFLNVCYFCEQKFFEKTCLIQHIVQHAQKNDFPPEKVWNQPEYFFPTYENDQFLVLLDNKDMESGDHAPNEEHPTISSVIPEDLPKLSISSSDLPSREDLKMDVGEFDYA